MTREQIAELRDWILSAVLYWGSHGRDVGVARTLPRLLDEREALKQALKRAADDLQAEYGGAPQYVTDAIAKAEAP